MEISIKDWKLLIGFSPYQNTIHTNRSIRRKKERKFKKALGPEFSTKEIKFIAENDKREVITLKIPVKK